MKLRCSPEKNRRGSTLMMVLVLSMATLMVLASTLDWTKTNNVLNNRNNEYFRTVAAAEAATEKSVAAIQSDYQSGGDSAVQNNLSYYRTLIPSSSEEAAMGNYAFNDAQNNAGKNYVQFMPPTAFRLLTAQYRGLYGYSSIFRVISNARDTTSGNNITAAVWQDVEVATVPLFQFAIFYNLDLEINPGANMTVNGSVHGNKDYYLNPGAALIFQGDVTGAGHMYNNRKPGDPTSPGSGTITFQAEHDSGVSTLNLPIGTDNTASNVHEVVKAPPSGESATSAMGAQRIYNKADLIVTVSDPAGTNTAPVVSVTSGIINSKATDVSTSSVVNTTWRWLDATNTLYNRRESKTVKAITIDVSRLVAWNSSSNNTLPNRSTSGSTKDVTVVFVDDQRTMTSSQETGVLLKNGALLPPYGLTVVTPEPIYVAGYYNVKATSAGSPVLGSTNTSLTLPAALIGDSITILSPTWNTTNSGYGTNSFSNRVATDSTVNAAFLAGVVETVSGSYSGGVENFPRFLEDWNNRTFTYNGSMVVMFPSQYATGLWQGTGSTIGIYNPPTRNWSFDTNFRTPSKLPPGTPAVRVLVRGGWSTIKPNTTTIYDSDAIDALSYIP